MACGSMRSKSARGGSVRVVATQRSCSGVRPRASSLHPASYRISPLEDAPEIARHVEVERPSAASQSAGNLEPKEIEEGLNGDAYARVSSVCVSGVERAGALNHRGLRKRCHSGLPRNPAESAERNSGSRDGHPPFGACGRAYLRRKLMNRVTGRAYRPAEVEPLLGDHSLRSADDAPAREQRQTPWLTPPLQPRARSLAHAPPPCPPNPNSPP